jgi:hypothetical protein
MSTGTMAIITDGFDLSVKERHSYYVKIVSLRTPSNSPIADSWYFIICSSITWAKGSPVNWRTKDENLLELLYEFSSHRAVGFKSYRAVNTPRLGYKTPNI